ncbi:hypothetical protein ACFQL4_18545 [Halosimplex aquaticum]
MTAEPLAYRARKWALQQISSVTKRPDQHDRLAETDWDVLVVLDACRYDALQRVTHWPVERCRSPGSATGHWLEECGRSGVLEDSYVATGNVNYANFDVGAAAVDHVWEDHWNDRLGNVLPEPVLGAADDFLADGERPVVAHLLPPHAPYVAEVGDTWIPAFPDVDVWRRNPGREDEDKLSPQVAMASGHVDMERAIAGYHASVEATWEAILPTIGEWVDRDLTVVVTADHGETFGRWRDWKLYGHPNRVHVRPLVEVPWIVFEQAPPVEADDAADGVQEKLEALGYVE